MESTRKSKTSSSTNLREQADAAIERWRSDESASAAARKEHQSAAIEAEKQRRVMNALAPMNRLALIASEVNALELEDVARQTECRATPMLDAAERAEGLELAIACDPERLRADLVELVAEEQRLKAKHQDAHRRLFARITDARDARTQLETNRRAAALPPPIRLPSGTAFSGLLMPEILIEQLESMRDQVPTPTKSNTEKIRQLHQEDTRLRADLEQQRLDREEEAADAARQRKVDREAEERRTLERQKETEAQMAKITAERKRDEQLAAAHRARSAG